MINAFNIYLILLNKHGISLNPKDVLVSKGVNLPKTKYYTILFTIYGMSCLTIFIDLYLFVRCSYSFII